jgi:hypothetical protein
MQKQGNRGGGLRYFFFVARSVLSLLPCLGVLLSLVSLLIFAFLPITTA